MESFCRAFVLFAFAAWAGKAASAATQHMVGGSQGWDESADLTSWASGRTFKVGDQLSMSLCQLGQAWQIRKIQIQIQ